MGFSFMRWMLSEPCINKLHIVENEETVPDEEKQRVANLINNWRKERISQVYAEKWIVPSSGDREESLFIISYYVDKQVE